MEESGHGKRKEEEERKVVKDLMSFVEGDAKRMREELGRWKKGGEQGNRGWRRVEEEGEKMINKEEGQKERRERKRERERGRIVSGKGMERKKERRGN